MIKPSLDSVGFAEISTIALTDAATSADNVVCSVNRTAVAHPSTRTKFRYGACRPFPCAPAKVPYLNRERALGSGSKGLCSCSEAALFFCERGCHAAGPLGSRAKVGFRNILR